MKIRIRLIKPSSGYSLTLWGWLTIMMLIFLLLIWWALSVQNYLSPTRPQQGARVLMVEGFIPDYALKEAARTFENGHYDVLITTGQAITQGSFLSNYGSLADVAYETLKHIGVDSSKLFSAPALPVWRDRSVANAQAGYKKLKDLGIDTCAVNVVSLSVHSRRSWLIYKKIGDSAGYRTGIIAVADSTYDEQAWWKSSRGLRAVFAESLGYYYVALFGLSD